MFKELSEGMLGSIGQKVPMGGSQGGTKDTELLDGHDFTKMMSIFQEAMSTDPSMKKKADSLWKFLDDLHDSNPKEYNDFIKKHLDEGKKEMEKENEKELKTNGIQSEPVICVKIRLFELISGHKDAKLNQRDIKLFDFETTEELKDSQSEIKQKHLAKPCIYLNVWKSDKVKAPLDKNRAYADVKDDKTWAIIPISYGQESWNDDEIIYDAHINTGVIDRWVVEKRIMNSVLLVILKRFQSLMAFKYRMDIQDIHILSEKMYRSSDPTKTKPALHLLMPDWDPKMHDEYVKKIKSYQTPDVSLPINTQKKEENDENLDAESLRKELNLFEQNEQPKKKTKIVEVTKVNKHETQKADPSLVSIPKGETVIKESTIKSIDDYNTEEELKKMNKSQKEHPEIEINFNIVHDKGNIQLKFLLPKEKSAANIDIQINDSNYMLESPNYIWKGTFQAYHPYLKQVKVYTEGEKGPKTSFSKSKGILTIYMTEK